MARAINPVFGAHPAADPFYDGNPCFTRRIGFPFQRLDQAQVWFWGSVCARADFVGISRSSIDQTAQRAIAMFFGGFSFGHPFDYWQNIQN